MSEYAEAQQATADGLATLGLQVTLMVHYPSKIHAPEGILLTTYDQLHPQIAKQEATAYAFPSFGAAQTVMRSLEAMQQTVFFIYECHANTGPVEIAAKVFDTCHKHIGAVKEVRQLTDPLKYQKYFTVLYCVQMEWSPECSTVIEWQLPDSISDELLMPARLAFENSGGIELRQGRCPGISETTSSPNGCYNSDKSKGSAPVTIKYNKTAGLAITHIREEIELLMRQSDISQDTQFQIKEGVDWHRMHRLRETAEWTIMSTRHLNGQSRLLLAQELMSFRIKYYYLSKAQIIMQLSGVDVEVLRNLLHCSTTYLPFGQRQQSTQISICQVTPIGGSLCRMVVNYSPIGSFPSIPLQISKSSILSFVNNEDDIGSTDLGNALTTALAAAKFEFQVVSGEDNTNTPMLTFWVPNDIKMNFPSNFSVKNKDGTTTSLTIEHCGNILPQTGAPGEPPRHETKSEHWRRVGEKSNPSFKNRLTVIAPASIQSAPQKRRFGVLKDAVANFNGQQCSYTYAEETFPWILFLERPPEHEILHTFLTHFGDTEAVQSGKGDYCKQSFLQSESVSKSTRIVMLEIPSGKKCQINRIEGAEDSLYLTKVDALKIYSFRASYIAVLVPPFIDFRALLSLDNKAEVSVIWKFRDFSPTCSSRSQSEQQHDVQCAPQPSQKLSAQNLENDAILNTEAEAGFYQPSPERAARIGTHDETPNTPLSQVVNPYQNTVPTPDDFNDTPLKGQQEHTNIHFPDNNEEQNVHPQAAMQEPHQHEGDYQGRLTISPTATWTQLPTRQPPKAEGKQADKKTDVPTTYPQLPQVATPPKKIAQALDQLSSSQKECPKGPPPACTGVNRQTDKAVTTAPQASDPILTPTSPQLEDVHSHAYRRNVAEDDLIEVTPIEEPRCTGNQLKKPVEANTPTQDHAQAQHRGVVIELTNGVQEKPLHPTRTLMPTRSGKGNSKGSPFQDALQRATTLSANDRTRICIDITGDENDLNNDDTMSLPSGHEKQTQLSQPQCSSLAPFVQVCRKWFYSFDPNIIDALAAKAQDIAIHYCHIAGMNNALYLLSQGPWVPAHVSVHVRQAALAAVGLGWSWSKQIPTVFPFTCYEDCLSIATLDRIPPNSATPNDALYDFYTTIGANLCQPTRKFLFSKVEIRCQTCSKVSMSCVDTFHMTIGKNTDAAMISELLIPCVNMQNTEEDKACSCVNIQKAQTQCAKLGPLIIVRILTPEGVSLPTIEEERFRIGHTFVFKTREYAIHSLITTTRLDATSQMIIVQAHQAGSSKLYDHNNGVRIVEQRHVSSKLLISGFVILPVKSPKAVLMTKQLAEATGEADTVQYKKKRMKVMKDHLKSPKRRKRTGPLTSSSPVNKGKGKPSASAKRGKKKGKHGPSKSDNSVSTPQEIDGEGLPREAERKALAKVGIISMFDGVGSVYHIIKKKLGRPPTILIAAEIDPILRRLVANEIGMREDQQWGYTIEGTATIYVKDVWTLTDKDSQILRQAKAMHPELKWIVIAGSPCQDLTYAGFLNGLLGLTGQRSMLFFVVYIVILHLQKLYGVRSVRYLTENAGSMQPVHPNNLKRNANCLEHSEHFQLFLFCLGLPSNQPVRQWIWDTSRYYGIQRKRIFLRSHLDTDTPPTNILNVEKDWGQLVMINGEELPIAPLLRTRGITNQGILKLSWTGYQPCALMWDYSFFGGKKSFRLLSQLTEGKKIPSLPWANIIPAHFLAVWRSFLITIQSDKSGATKKDQLVEQLVPLFHNPNIKVPMRILTVQEVRKLAGLESILTTERHGTSLLTEQVVRDFCGNSFHPSLISAALGTDDQLQQWVQGTNDAQPCATELPCVKDAYAKYRHLLQLVIEQASNKGYQLKSDRIDFEAKWQHLAPKTATVPVQPPAIRQPMVFSFLQGSKAIDEQRTRAAKSIHYGDEEFYSCLDQYGLDWLRESAHTYENITLSAHMMQLAVQNGIGCRTESQEIRVKHAQLLQQYTANERLKAIEQLFVVLQIATLSSLHQFPFGFLIWAPKVMQPPMVYVGAQRPCLIFLILSQETDQPFNFGTVAFDYRQDRDYLAHVRIPNIFADVVQLSYHPFASFPITVRVNEGQQYIHLSEFAALQCPICALCYLHSLGAAPCFLHQVTTADAIMHIVGGMDGTGGLIILGTIVAEAQVTSETVKWIVIHVLDNQQAQCTAGIEAFTPYQHSVPICWSPIWFAQASTQRRRPRQIGTCLINSHTADQSGEYLICSHTEEWSRLLFARNEAPMES